MRSSRFTEIQLIFTIFRLNLHLLRIRNHFHQLGDLLIATSSHHPAPSPGFFGGPWPRMTDNALEPRSSTPPLVPVQRFEHRFGGPWGSHYAAVTADPSLLEALSSSLTDRSEIDPYPGNGLRTEPASRCPETRTACWWNHRTAFPTTPGADRRT